MLHNGESWDYETLHFEMALRQFHREITSNTGLRYELPHAEYFSHGSLTAEDVLRLAEAAVAETGLTAEIMVTESSRTVGSGLTPVSPVHRLRALLDSMPYR